MLNTCGYAIEVPNDRPLFASVSGGRTSGMMAALLSTSAIMLFANTGREHPKTYEFLRKLDASLDG